MTFAVPGLQGLPVVLRRKDESSTEDVAGKLPTQSREQWREPMPSAHRRADGVRGMTLWLAGLTRRHDQYLCAALRGLGYRAWPMAAPDNEALKIGKEFCNRGQCNPTYYTAGNLIRHLRSLEANGIDRDEIIANHALLTAGSCGPCRFGMYATEYRKALRQAGYEGFRILELSQYAMTGDASEQSGFEVNRNFIVDIVKSVVAADVLNMLGYRIRPYEQRPGATDEALSACDAIVIKALEQRRSVLRALRRCRSRIDAIEVDKLQPKPVVLVIGEIWAMTTEGDGNYGIHRFLEREGAEVMIEPVYNWLFYLFWDQRYEVLERRGLRVADSTGRGLAGRSDTRPIRVATMMERLLRLSIRLFAAAVGLSRPPLPDIGAMAEETQPFYDSDVRGGEAFMEVGKYMEAAQQRLCHLVVSVKPFGCLPSSGVSDGVQSLVTARYPETAFYAVETTGDGKSSVYSRLQMMLFNAHKRAQSEFSEALATIGCDEAEARRRALTGRGRSGARYQPPHRCPTTAANVTLSLRRGFG